MGQKYLGTVNWWYEVHVSFVSLPFTIMKLLPLHRDLTIPSLSLRSSYTRKIGCSSTTQNVLWKYVSKRSKGTTFLLSSSIIPNTLPLYVTPVCSWTTSLVEGRNWGSRRSHVWLSVYSCKVQKLPVFFLFPGETNPSIKFFDLIKRRFVKHSL